MSRKIWSAERETTVPCNCLAPGSPLWEWVRSKAESRSAKDSAASPVWSGAGSGADSGRLSLVMMFTQSLSHDSTARWWRPDWACGHRLGWGAKMPVHVEGVQVVQSMTRRDFVRVGAGAMAAGAAVKATLLEPAAMTAQTAAGGATGRKIRFVSIGTGIRGCDLLRSARAVPTGECVGAAGLLQKRHRT